MKALIFTIISLCVASPILSNRISSYPFISGDTFRAIANHIIDETNLKFNPSSVKNGDIIFLKTDYVPLFFPLLHRQITNKYILITHNSDCSPLSLNTIHNPQTELRFAEYLDDPKLIFWFAQNVDNYKHEKLIPLPIGIANSQWTHGRKSLFEKALRQIPTWDEKQNRVYVNFSIPNNPKERKTAWNYFSNKSFSFCTEMKPPAQYLNEMKQFRFAVAPFGNGNDCHRTWEALLLNCIPITKHSALDPLFEDLPVILVDDWSEITASFLVQKYTEMKKRTYKWEKAYADYWIKRIRKIQASNQ